MKDFGWDISYAVWLLLGLIISAPLFIYEPLVLLIIVAITLFLAGLRQIMRYRNLANWVGIQGTLIGTSLGKYRVSIGQYSKPEEYYFPLAKFSYAYNGIEYASNQYAFDRKSIWTRDQEVTAKIIDELNAQKTIQVFVNPRHPGEAVINSKIISTRWSHA
jgi:hypothetical protein